MGRPSRNKKNKMSSDIRSVHDLKILRYFLFSNLNIVYHISYLVVAEAICENYYMYFFVCLINLQCV